MGQIHYTYRARDDLLDIWAYIAGRNPNAADRVFDLIKDRCSLLRGHPQLGPARTDIAPDARLLVVERWLVLYRIVNDGVQIVRIVDGARDLARLEWSVE